MRMAFPSGKRGCAFLLLGTATLMVAWVAYGVVRFTLQRSRPGVLTIHCDPAQCGEITVTKEEVPELLNAPATRSGVMVSPISYGPYKIEVSLQDRKRLWLSYYHSD